MEGGGSSPLFSTDESTAGVLYSVLGSSAQDIHGHIRVYRLGHFSLTKRRLRENLINVYEYMKGSSKEDRARLFSVVPSGRTRDNGLKLKYRRLCLNVRKHFFL